MPRNALKVIMSLIHIIIMYQEPIHGDPVEHGDNDDEEDDDDVENEYEDDGFIVDYEEEDEERQKQKEMQRKKNEDLLLQDNKVNFLIEKLSDIQCQPESQLKFIREAWLQIVECRRVLKWTYGDEFYIPDHEHGKRVFFEYLQGEAESILERLHLCAERELLPYLDANEGPCEDFNEFRKKLSSLTSVTKTYFENLVRALENGLSDVTTHGAYDQTSSSNSLEGTKGSTSKASSSDSASTSKASSSDSASTSKTSSSDSAQWSCEYCTCKSKIDHDLPNV